MEQRVSGDGSLDTSDVEKNNNMEYNIEPRKNNFDFDVQEGDLTNEFHDALEGREWAEYYDIMNKVLNSTYGNFDRTDVINGKLVSTIFENGKEQVYNVIKVNGNTKPLINFVKEVANKYGYSAREVQEVVESMYGEEDVSIYNPTCNQFEPLFTSREDRGLSIGEDTDNDRRTTKERDGENNKRSKELDNSSFF